MAERGIDMTVFDAAPRFPERLNQFLRLPCRIQPVAGEAHHLERRLCPFYSVLQRAVIRANVEVVNGLGDDQVTVGIEPANELLALVAP